MTPLSLTWSNWLRFNETLKFFEGLPTNADVGAYSFFLQAVDSANQFSPPLFFTINVPLDVRLEPNILLLLTFDRIATRRRRSESIGDFSASFPDFLSQQLERHRRACPPDSLTLTITERLSLVSVLSSFFDVFDNDINIVSITGIIATCQVEVSASDNSAASCTAATNRQEQIENGAEELRSLLSSVSATLRIASLSVDIQDCPVVALPGTTTGSEEMLSTTIVPAIVIAAVILSLVIVALVLLRRRSMKDERGINNETFGARVPVVLETDRQVGHNEFERHRPATLSSAPWLYDKGYVDVQTGPSSPTYQYAQKQPPILTEDTLASKFMYRPPPAYPYEVGTSNYDETGLFKFFASASGVFLFQILFICYLLLRL